MNVLIEHEDGQPALVEHQVGRGRVAVLTTSVDRDLSDLPIRPGFVPLMRQLILHLGHALAQPDPRRTLVRQTRELKVPRGATRLVVLAPDGETTHWEQSELASQTVPFTETNLPGHYRVQVAFAGPLEDHPSEHFSVNVDTQESDLRPLEEDEARAILLGVTDSQPRAMASGVRHLSDVTPDTIATFLLLLMACAFVLESLLTAPAHRPLERGSPPLTNYRASPSRSTSCEESFCTGR